MSQYRLVWWAISGSLTNSRKMLVLHQRTDSINFHYAWQVKRAYYKTTQKCALSKQLVQWQSLINYILSLVMTRIVYMFYCYQLINQSHRYGRRQADCREPTGSYDKTTRTAICFEHKTQYLLTRAPYTRIVVFWLISNIQPAVGCYNSYANTVFGLLSARGKIIVKQVY